MERDKSNDVHGGHDDARPSPAAVRAPAAIRTVQVSTADAQRWAAEDFDAAIRDAGRPSNGSIGEAFGGIDEAIVRELRDPDGTKRITVARLYQAGDALLEAWLRRIVARRAAKRGEPLRAKPEQQAMVCIRSNGNVSARIATSLLDGRYSAAEAEADLPAVREEERDVVRLRECLEKLAKGEA